MKKLFLLQVLLLILSNCNVFAQNDGWRLRTDFQVNVGDMVYKQYGKIKFTFYPDISMAERSSMIKRTNLYIKQNLAILGESGFNDSIDIILIRDRNDMIKFAGDPIGGMTYTTIDQYIKQKTIICIGGDKNPFKHELMHMVSRCKWGSPADIACFTWLEEGLATYADPNAECDNYSFEEKYVYFIQNKRLISADSLINHFERQHPKTAYNQSAYIVKYLIDNYGIANLKKLWVSKMDDFVTMYGLSFNDLMAKIEVELTQKYPDPIEFDWNEFERKCY